ncbi:DUF6268 family outer membrane beta-barrel protein [Sphingobacterium spiritivorum]|nr:DUF6268 family outer membrane beta-barrel protein [Sphingobacterium spiritivorum]WQD36230.1 DUF6268 family outer membrane beta-barrel protein [Sphingobacterium spiritivorum]SUJ04940.1 Uncharacterised protein [Sphingobacterium spiritivorum]
MNITIRIALSLCSIIPMNTVLAQSADSVAREAQITKLTLAYAALKFKELRPFNAEYSYLTPYNYSAQIAAENLPDRKMTNFSQAMVGVNLNLIKKQKWALGTTLGYRYIMTESEPTYTSGADKSTQRNDYQAHYTSVNLAYFTRFFNKMTIFSSSVAVDGSEKDFERVRGLITGTMILKANRQTRMAIGLLWNIDPSALIPIIPTFLYEHEFDNGFIADINLPRNLMLRKHVFRKGRVSMGAELDGNSFYLYNIDGTSQKYQYSQMDINSGFVYEHLLGNYFIIAAKTGVRIVPTARVFEKEKSFEDYIYKIKPDPAFYFNIGLSFNPFSKIKRK